MASAEPDQLDVLRNKPDSEITLKDILNGMAGVRDSITTRLTALEGRLGELDDLKREVRDLKEDCDDTKVVVENLLAAGDAFPSNTSLIILNMPMQEDEDEDSLLQSVIEVIEDGLELRDIVIDAVERAPQRTYADATNGESGEGDGSEVRPGVVKVRLASLAQKKKCLQNKQKLHSKAYYKDIFIRGGEDHASRLNRLNMNTLLTELKMREKFRFTGSGRLMRRHDLPQDGDPGEAAPDGGRGPSLRSQARGRGRGGRGGQGGRGGGGDQGGRGGGGDRGGRGGRGSQGGRGGGRGERGRN